MNGHGKLENFIAGHYSDGFLYLKILPYGM
jgi:hypothetical protein